MLLSAGKVSTESEGVALIEEMLCNSQALNKFKQMIVTQGVNAEVAEKLCSITGQHDWEVEQSS